MLIVKSGLLGGHLGVAQVGGYTASGGGFEVVEGWRLRMGPQEGERWYTFDEMQAIKEERRATEGAR